MLDVKALVPGHHILLMTLDTLRYDVAAEELATGRTPVLAGLLPGHRWEARHSPGSFTYAAHQAFFAGFLPTPLEPGPHPRPFALNFPQSGTVGPGTLVLDAATLPQGLARLGYRTVCIGGVDFFDRRSPLGSVLPGLFQESYWSPDLGVTDPRSTEHQVELACRLIRATDRPLFLFINVSAIHRPNRHYLPGRRTDDRATHAAALRYVDAQLPRLFHAMGAIGRWLCVLTSDHGTCYGDDGYRGHRLAHPAVWTVPYGEFVHRSL